ncbi:MAG: GNAT family N-acetyltransferase [Paraburkholderia sp.]
MRQRVDGSFLGLAGLHHVRNISTELGIWIREDFHTQRVGREAVSLVARWASLAPGIESFTYPVAGENYPSRRIAESLWRWRASAMTGHSRSPQESATIRQKPPYREHCEC